MVAITKREKEVLSQWIPEVDLSKVKIKRGRFAEIFCGALGASAVTMGNTIYARHDSWIYRFPPEHPLRLALLAHELYHVKQEKKYTLVGFFIVHNFISVLIMVPFLAYLSLKTIGKFLRWMIHEFSWVSHRLNPFERSAEKLEKKFLAKHWTQEEAMKWGWKPEQEKKSSD